MAGNVIAGKDSVFCNDAVFIANVASLQSGDTVACLVPVDKGTAIIQGWNKISIERMSVDKPVVMRYNQYQRSDYFRTRILLRVRVFFFISGFGTRVTLSIPWQVCRSQRDSAHCHRKSRAVYCCRNNGGRT